MRAVKEDHCGTAVVSLPITRAASANQIVKNNNPREDPTSGRHVYLISELTAAEEEKADSE